MVQSHGLQEIVVVLDDVSALLDNLLAVGHHLIILVVKRWELLQGLVALHDPQFADFTFRFCRLHTLLNYFYSLFILFSLDHLPCNRCDPFLEVNHAFEVNTQEFPLLTWF